MKVFKKGLFVLATALFCVAIGYGQKQSVAVKADNLFDQKRYVEALESYQNAYKKLFYLKNLISPFLHLTYINKNLLFIFNF